MDITSVEFSGGMTATLPIFGAQPTDPYILKGADGLGPPENDVFKGGTAQGQRVLQSIRPKDRQLVFRVGLNPNYSVGQRPESLRSALYALISSKHQPVVVSFKKGSTVKATASGYISKFETVPFSKEPLVQITIDTLDPYLKHPEEIVLTVGNGLPTGGVNATISNPGDAPSPMIIQIKATATMPFYIMNNSTNNEAIGFAASGAFVANDIITLDTRPGKRDLTRQRGTATTSMISYLSMINFDWITLAGGDNVLGPDEFSGTWDWVSVTYTPMYQGV